MTTPEPGKWYTVENEAHDSYAPVYVKRVKFGMAYCTCQSKPLELRVDEWEWHERPASESRITVSDILQECPTPAADAMVEKPREGWTE